MQSPQVIAQYSSMHGGAVRPPEGPRQSPGGGPGGKTTGSSKQSASYSI